MSTSNAHKRTTDSFTSCYTSKLLSLTESRLLTNLRSYGPSQADVKCFQATKSQPKVEKFPHAYRWYKHISSFEPEFSSLPGDPSKAYTAYGPEASELPTNTKAPNDNEEDDDDDVDLFGSDDEEEDEEAEKLKQQRLEEYKKKKEGKVKPAAKSIVTLDVKPWGVYPPLVLSNLKNTDLAIRRRRNRHERTRAKRSQHRKRRPRLGRL